MHWSVRWEINHVRFATCHVFNQDLCLTLPRRRATPTCVCVYISMKLNSACFNSTTSSALNVMDYSVNLFKCGSHYVKSALELNWNQNGKINTLNIATTNEDLKICLKKIHIFCNALKE
jgi:hypothetical protein